MFGGTLPLFLIYFYINRAVIQYLYILLVGNHSCYPHCIRSVEGLLWGAEPRFELGPAVQQADALQSEPHRTLRATPHPNEPHRTLFQKYIKVDNARNFRSPNLPSLPGPAAGNLVNFFMACPQIFRYCCKFNKLMLSKHTHSELGRYPVSAYIFCARLRVRIKVSKFFTIFKKMLSIRLTSSWARQCIPKNTSLLSGKK